MIAGVSLILIAAVLQGVFLLPMQRARQWAWEHVWLVFSLTGMLLCNWILTLLRCRRLVVAAALVQLRVVVEAVGREWRHRKAETGASVLWISIKP